MINGVKGLADVRRGHCKRSLVLVCLLDGQAERQGLELGPGAGSEAKLLPPDRPVHFSPIAIHRLHKRGRKPEQTGLMQLLENGEDGDGAKVLALACVGDLLEKVRDRVLPSRVFSVAVQSSLEGRQDDFARSRVESFEDLDTEAVMIRCSVPFAGL